NLKRRSDALPWYQIVRGTIEPQIEDEEFAATAARLLPEEPGDETTWSKWIGSIKDATGRNGKALFRPLRLALTGEDSGPELKFLLPLIGREKGRRRLLAASCRSLSPRRLPGAPAPRPPLRRGAAQSHVCS